MVVLPKISIITPTLNRSSLKDACESVDKQTFQNWHHYVIGDGCLPYDYPSSHRTTIGFTNPIGSTQPALDKPDGTPNPILAWALDHLELFDYVCFLDDDNIYRSTFLEKMLSALLNNPKRGIAICAVENMRGNWQETDGFPEYRRCDNSGFLARSTLAKKIGFPKATRDKECMQDYEFIRLCSENSGWVHVPEKLTVFGFAPNPPPNRGVIRIIDSWSLPTDGVILIKSGKFYEGLIKLQEAFEYDSNDAWALWHLGEAFLCIGDLRAAKLAWIKWKALVKKLPQLPDSWSQYCYSLATSFIGDEAEAKEALNLAISTAKNEKITEIALKVENCFNLGLYFLVMYEPEIATSYYNKALLFLPASTFISDAIWNLNILNKTNLIGDSANLIIDTLRSYLKNL